MKVLGVGGLWCFRDKETVNSEVYCNLRSRAMEDSNIKIDDTGRLLEIFVTRVRELKFLRFLVIEIDTSKTQDFKRKVLDF